MQDFEEKIRHIFHLIAEYGITKKSLDFRHPKKITQKDKDEFLIEVHKGFRLGQDEIIKQIIPLLKEREALLKEELEAKKTKNKQLLEEKNSQKIQVEYKIRILRHFADFIAWQIFRNDYYKARRFYSGSRTRPDLLHSNLVSVLYTVESFHNEDEKNFALISDLTSFIDIGDILLVNGSDIFIVECKQGNVQKKVFDFIDELRKDDFDVRNIDFTDKNQKFFDQVERTLRQFERGGKVVDFLKNEKGTDPFSEMKVNVFEAEKPNEYYFDYLLKLIEESKINDSTYGSLGGIIYIGIYRNTKLEPSRFVFDYIVQRIYEKYIIVDYLTILNIPLKEPLFFKPFGKDIIFDLIFERIKIFFAVNLEALIELFDKKGIEAKWLSRKETHKFTSVRLN